MGVAGVFKPFSGSAMSSEEQGIEIDDFVAESLCLGAKGPTHDVKVGVGALDRSFRITKPSMVNVTRSGDNPTKSARSRRNASMAAMEALTRAGLVSASVLPA